MQKYINHLIEDLEHVAKNPPKPDYFEVPPHLDEAPEVAELALVPFKTIEVLTGIKQEVFPEMIDLHPAQCQQVNEAILKMLGALHIDVVDIPEGIPPEVLYESLTLNWDFEVQYLPSTGMDMELCTGDPDTCRYGGNYCTCGEEFDEFEIPERFLKVLNPIAQAIDAGLVCFLNPDTLEIEEIPQLMLENPHEFEMMTGVSLEEEEQKHLNWKSCYTFEPLESFESFKIMEAFVANLDDEAFSDELYDTLHKRKPFSNFKWKIDNSDYRQDWFDFKQKWLEDHVKEQICKAINKIDDYDLDDVELPF